MSTVPGCEVVESGPPDAEHTVLLLPGGWCTALFYDELMAEPAVAGLRLVAVTLPGNGGTPPPDDLSMESYATLTADLAAHLHCDVVVGHSLGANVALEMAGSGAFAGPVVLLAPCFSRRDEAIVIRVLDRLALVLGHLPFRVMRTMMRFAVRDTPLHPHGSPSSWPNCRRTTPKSCAAASANTCSTWTGTAPLPLVWAPPVYPPGSSTAKAATAVSPWKNDAPCRPTHRSGSSPSPGGASSHPASSLRWSRTWSSAQSGK